MKSRLSHNCRIRRSLPVERLINQQGKSAGCIEIPVVNLRSTGISLPYASFAFVIWNVASIETIATHRNASAAKRPGHMRLPRPKIGSLDVAGLSMNSPSPFMNLSGLNSSGSSNFVASRLIAHTLIMTKAPFGI